MKKQTYQRRLSVLPRVSESDNDRAGTRLNSGAMGIALIAWKRHYTLAL